MLDDIDKIYEEIKRVQPEGGFHFLLAPSRKGLKRTLKENKIYMQQHHGRFFVRNHRHCYLKENVCGNICDSVVHTTKQLTSNKKLLNAADYI